MFILWMDDNNNKIKPYEGSKCCERSELGIIRTYLGKRTLLHEHLSKIVGYISSSL
jgi:hypothetical protein